jgi:hypothetical protein
MKSWELAWSTNLALTKLGVFLRASFGSMRPQTRNNQPSMKAGYRTRIKTLISGIIVLTIGLFVQQTTQAQETTYLSNLGASIGSVPIGSDSWLGMEFETGRSTNGYTLNSIQLEMADASGNPNGFTVIIEPLLGPEGPFTGGSLGSFGGSTNPATSGIYTYTPIDNITLSPTNVYFIILTAGTSIADGAYNWSIGTSHPASDDVYWGAASAIAKFNNGYGPPTLYSNDGQYAINATAVPEPNALGLFSICILIFCWRINRPNHSLEPSPLGVLGVLGVLAVKR